MTFQGYPQGHIPVYIEGNFIDLVAFMVYLERVMHDFVTFKVAQLIEFKTISNAYLYI